MKKRQGDLRYKRFRFIWIVVSAIIIIALSIGAIFFVNNLCTLEKEKYNEEDYMYVQRLMSNTILPAINRNGELDTVNIQLNTGIAEYNISIENDESGVATINYMTQEEYEKKIDHKQGVLCIVVPFFILFLGFVISSVLFDLVKVKKAKT